MEMKLYLRDLLDGIDRSGRVVGRGSDELEKVCEEFRAFH